MLACWERNVRRQWYTACLFIVQLLLTKLAGETAMLYRKANPVGPSDESTHIFSIVVRAYDSLENGKVHRCSIKVVEHLQVVSLYFIVSVFSFSCSSLSYFTYGTLWLDVAMDNCFRQ